MSRNRYALRSTNRHAAQLRLSLVFRPRDSIDVRRLSCRSTASERHLPSGIADVHRFDNGKSLIFVFDGRDWG